MDKQSQKKNHHEDKETNMITGVRACLRVKLLQVFSSSDTIMTPFYCSNLAQKLNTSLYSVFTMLYLAGFLTPLINFSTKKPFHQAENIWDYYRGSTRKARPMHNRVATCPVNQFQFMISTCVDPGHESTMIIHLKWGLTFILCTTRVTLASPSKRKGTIALQVTLRACIHI